MSLYTVKNIYLFLCRSVQCVFNMIITALPSHQFLPSLQLKSRKIPKPSLPSSVILNDIRKQSHSIGKWSTGSKLVMTISISLNFFLVSINDQFNLKENRKVQHDVHRTDPVLQQLHLCVNQVQCPSVWPFLWWFNYFPLNKISISKVKLFRYIFLDIINNVVTYFKYRLTFNQQINLLTFRCQCQFSLCNLQLHFCK